MGKYQKIDRTKLEHKKLKKSKKVKSPTKLENIYNKYNNQEKNSIKQKKTVKHTNNLFLNKNKISKKNKIRPRTSVKRKANKTNNIKKGGAVLMKKSYLKKINKINSAIDNINKELATNLNNLIMQKDKLKKEYINTFEENIDFILDQFANKNIDFLETTEKKETANSFKIMRDRMIILNKVFRFSTQVGQTLSATDTNSKLFKINNKPKNFYYKHRHQRSTKFAKKHLLRNSSKIKSQFYMDTIWAQIALYREYQMNVETSIKSIIYQQDHRAEIKANLQEKEEDKASIFKEAADILESNNNIFLKHIKNYNEFNNDTIHFYLGKMNFKNIHMLLLKIPSKKMGTYDKIKNIMVSKEDYIKNKQYDDVKIKQDGLLDKHAEANKLLMKRCQLVISTFFEKVNKVTDKSTNKVTNLLKDKDISYLTNYKILTEVNEMFTNINNIFLFNLEKKPYIDMGQVSMLSYENSMTETLSSLTNKNNDFHINGIYNQDEMHREYFNNILHLPNFITKYLDISMIESAKTTYDDDYYKKTKGTDKDKLQTIIDETKFFKQNYTEKVKKGTSHKFSSDKLKLNNNNRILYDTSEGAKSASEQLADEDDNGPMKIDMGNDTSASDTKLEGNFFMPISTYHALFKIKNFDAITKVKINKSFFGDRNVSFSERNDIRNGISKLFFINKYDDIIPGTILYLYKQIAFHLDFLYNNRIRGATATIGLYQLFLKDIMSFALIKKDQEDQEDLIDVAKEIKRNIGIFRGIENKELYIYYTMLIIMEHANRLLQCVNDLKYLTDKIHKFNDQTDTINKEYNKIKTESEVKNFIDVHEHVVSHTNTNNIYRKNDDLSNDDKNKINIKEEYIYKQLIFYIINKNVDTNFDVEIINNILQHLSNLKTTSVENPAELKLIDYIHNVPYGIDKNTLYNNIRDGVIINNNKDGNNKNHNILFNNKELLKEKTYLHSIIQDITFVEGEGNESINFDIKDLNKILINDKVALPNLKTELFYLILKLFDYNNYNANIMQVFPPTTLQPGVFKTYLGNIKNKISDKKHIFQYINEFIMQYKIPIKSNINSYFSFNHKLNKKDNILNDNYDAYGDSTLNLIHNELFKFIKLFNILNIDMFLFFKNKTFREKYFYLNTLKEKIPYYAQYYKDVDNLKIEIDKTIKILEDLQKIDEQIEKIFIDNIIKENHSIKIKYKYEKGKSQALFFDNYDKTDTKDTVKKNITDYHYIKFSEIHDDDKNDYIIYNIDIDEFKKNPKNEIEKMPDVVLGHIGLIHNRKINTESINILRGNRIQLIKDYNEKMSKISLFNELLYFYMKQLATINNNPSSTNVNINLYPIQFIFMKKEIYKDKDNTNYLIYKKFETKFDANNIYNDDDDIIDIISDYIVGEFNTHPNTLTDISSIYDPATLTFQEKFKSTIKTILNKIKQSEFYKDIIKIKELELILESIQHKLRNAIDESDIEKYHLEEQIENDKIKKLNKISYPGSTNADNFKIDEFKDAIDYYINNYDNNYYEKATTFKITGYEPDISKLIIVKDKIINFSVALTTPPPAPPPAPPPFNEDCSSELIDKFIKIYKDKEVNELIKEDLKCILNVGEYTNHTISKFKNFTLMKIFDTLLEDDNLIKEDLIINTTSRIALEKKAVLAAAGRAGTVDTTIQYQQHTFIPELIKELLSNSSQHFKDDHTILNASIFNEQIDKSHSLYDTVPIKSFKRNFDAFSIDLFNKIKETFILIPETQIDKITKIT
jgi:hypothetical protein